MENELAFLDSAHFLLLVVTDHSVTELKKSVNLWQKK
jgi:hypothetical protein